MLRIIPNMYIQEYICVCIYIYIVLNMYTLYIVGPRLLSVLRESELELGSE